MPLTAQVAVDHATIHFDKLYTYRLLPGQSGKVYPGSMVLVPFGRGDRPRMAVVLDVDAEPPADGQKTVLDVAGDDARLTADLLSLVHYLKEETFCTYYEAVKAVIPYGAQYRPGTADGRPVLRRGLRIPTETVYQLSGPLPEKPKPSEKQRRAVEALGGGPLPQSRLNEMGLSRAVLQTLCRKGVLEACTRRRVPDLYQAIPPAAEPICLTAEQQTAFDGLCRLLDGAPHAALLHGVTGSGKTLVFIKLIEQVLAQGKKALVLVPEIGLTPQMILRLKGTFGGRVAVQHSALSHTERLAQWEMIQSGGADIVVGTRSAVFAPLQGIGIIIIDEEQEQAYHSEASPRYSAKDVARLRVAQNGALLLLSSATPSIETYYRAQQGRYALFTLNERYAGSRLPRVELVDMRAELAAGNAREISLRLAEELAYNLSNRQQSILLLNRRGYRTLATCTQCRTVVKCRNCSVPMVFHKAQNRLMCHYCAGSVSPAPTVCPECGGKLSYTGYGTQRVEEELERLFPKATVLRMDQDTTSQKNAHERMLAQFAAGEYDILIGTQMVAKGLDFPRVTLVGVLGVDNLLFGSSFRSYERVFSLVTQVVGRGGRADLPGRAIVQTSAPAHPVLNLAAAQDYRAFYLPEVDLRRNFLYPPFCELCTLCFAGEKEQDVRQAAREFAVMMGESARSRGTKPLRILQPAPMSIAKLKGQYRYRLLLKCRNNSAFRALLRHTLEQYAARRLPAKAAVSIDFYADGDG